MKSAEIRLLSTQEIITKLENTRQELMNLRFQVITGQLTDTSRIKQTRRSVSRFASILREREIAEEQEGAK